MSMKSEIKLINIFLDRLLDWRNIYQLTIVFVAYLSLMPLLIVGVMLITNSVWAQATAYVAAGDLDAVVVIDAEPSSSDFNTVVETVPVGNFPTATAVTPDWSRAY